MKVVGLHPQYFHAVAESGKKNLIIESAESAAASAECALLRFHAAGPSGCLRTISL
jgi:hypothetical protein